MWLLDNLDLVVLGAIGAYLGLRLETMSSRLRRVELWIATHDPGYFLDHQERGE